MLSLLCAKEHKNYHSLKANAVMYIFLILYQSHFPAGTIYCFLQSAEIMFFFLRRMDH